MNDLFLRTEDIKSEHLNTLFVETEIDRKIIDNVKSQTPVLVVGSRGVGKSFILKIAEKELKDVFNKQRVLPVYVTFNKTSLVSTNDVNQFQNWMLAKICKATQRTLQKFGLSSSQNNFLSDNKTIKDILSTIINSYEQSWQAHNTVIDVSMIPDIEDFKETIEDICVELNISRIAYLFDEAVHVFQPEQQRQFFTLFRDMRSPYISCNAAVYPGVTSYGDTFQPSHDAITLNLDRNILDSDYISNMREIVIKQATLNEDDKLLCKISKNDSNFKALAYASSGNPRTLIKTISITDKLNSGQTNTVIKDFYRTNIWSDHSNLCSIYTGHRGLFDWGREFIENFVLKELKSRNDENLNEFKNSTFFIWIHRDAPPVVKLALNLLNYTGIITEHSTGIKGTRSEIGTRYSVNVGCLLSLEITPVNSVSRIVQGVTIKRFIEYGYNHHAFQMLSNDLLSPLNTKDILRVKLQQDINILDIPEWMIKRLKEVGFNTIEDVLTAKDEDIRKAYYIGEVRSRLTKDAATYAVLEYLSG